MKWDFNLFPVSYLKEILQIQLNIQLLNETTCIIQRGRIKLYILTHILILLDYSFNLKHDVKKDIPLNWMHCFLVMG